MNGCLERSLYVDIARSADVVFNYISTPTRWHEWIPTSRRIEQHVSPLSVGTSFEEEYDAGGKLVLYHWVVTEYDPPRRWKITAGAVGKAQVTFCYDFIARDPGTRFVRQLQISQLPRPLSPQSVARIDEESQHAMARIKTILENADFS